MTKPNTADPAEELRETIREAHGVLKDLRGVLKEIRQVRDSASRELVDKLNATLAEYNEALQADMNEEAARLNQEVTRARDYIAKQLTVARLVPDPDGKTLFLQWEGHLFDEHAKPPGGKHG